MPSHKDQRQLMFSNIDYLLPLARKLDFIACSQQGINQPAHTHILLSEVVILCLKNIKDMLASSFNVIVSLCKLVDFIESYLIINPENRFHCNKSHLILHDFSRPRVYKLS